MAERRSKDVTYISELDGTGKRETLVCPQCGRSTVSWDKLPEKVKAGLKKKGQTTSINVENLLYCISCKKGFPQPQLVSHKLEHIYKKWTERSKKRATGGPSENILIGALLIVIGLLAFGAWFLNILPRDNYLLLAIPLLCILGALASFLSSKKNSPAPSLPALEEGERIIDIYEPLYMFKGSSQIRGAVILTDRHLIHLDKKEPSANLFLNRDDITQVTFEHPVTIRISVTSRVKQPSTRADQSVLEEYRFNVIRSRCYSNKQAIAAPQLRDILLGIKEVEEGIARPTELQLEEIQNTYIREAVRQFGRATLNNVKSLTETLERNNIKVDESVIKELIERELIAQEEKGTRETVRVKPSELEFIAFREELFSVGRLLPGDGLARYISAYVDTFGEEDGKKIEFLLRVLAENEVAELSVEKLAQMIEEEKEKRSETGEIEQPEAPTLVEGEFANTLLSMRDNEFTAFLGDIFRIMGYDLERTDIAQDRAAELSLVEKDNTRVMVKAKRSIEDIDSEPIREAIAKKSILGFDKIIFISCVSSFTPEARDAASEEEVALWDKLDLEAKFNSFFGIPMGQTKTREVEVVEEDKDFLAFKDKLFTWSRIQPEDGLARYIQAYVDIFEKIEDHLLTFLARLLSENRVARLDEEGIAQLIGGEINKRDREAISAQEAERKDTVDDLLIMNDSEFGNILGDLFRLMRYDVQRTDIPEEKVVDMIMIDEIIGKKVLARAIRRVDRQEEIDESAVQNVISALTLYGCDRAILITTSRFNSTAKEEAGNEEIELWERRRFRDEINRYLFPSVPEEEIREVEGEYEPEHELMEGKLEVEEYPEEELREEEPIAEAQPKEVVEEEQRKAVVEDRNIERLLAMSEEEFNTTIQDLFEFLNYRIEDVKFDLDEMALITSKDGEKISISIKKVKPEKLIDDEQVSEAIDFSSRNECDKAIVVSTSNFTERAIQLASSKGVELWNKGELINRLTQFFPPSALGMETASEEVSPYVSEMEPKEILDRIVSGKTLDVEEDQLIADQKVIEIESILTKDYLEVTLEGVTINYSYPTKAGGTNLATRADITIKNISQEVFDIYPMMSLSLIDSSGGEYLSSSLYFDVIHDLGKTFEEGDIEPGGVRRGYILSPPIPENEKIDKISLEMIVGEKGNEEEIFTWKL